MAASGAVIKIGGSVLADKASPELRVDDALLARLAAELSAVTIRPLVLIHGAGSFGHRIAARVGLDRGLSDSDSRVAMGETQRRMYLLNARVTEALLRAGSPVMAVQASASAMMRDGNLERMELDAIRELLRQGLVPLLYGVPAVDRERGCAILSGDVIAAYLATHLPVGRVIHATNTDGVFAKDPHRHPEARRIRRIDPSNWSEVSRLLGGSAEVDVTGGMAGKVASLVKLAKLGTTSQIVSARLPGRIAAALAGEDVGTTIDWEKT